MYFLAPILKGQREHFHSSFQCVGPGMRMRVHIHMNVDTDVFTSDKFLPYYFVHFRYIAHCNQCLPPNDNEKHLRREGIFSGNFNTFVTFWSIFIWILKVKKLDVFMLNNSHTIEMSNSFGYFFRLKHQCVDESEQKTRAGFSRRGAIGRLCLCRSSTRRRNEEIWLRHWNEFIYEIV